jgi:exosortase
MEAAVPEMRPAAASTAVPWTAVLFFGALAAVWFGVFHVLSSEWEANPQYGYGWFVPLLGGGIFWNRWRTRPDPAPPGGLVGALLFLLLVPLLAALAGATLVGAANAEWRYIMWVLSLLAVALSFVLMALAGGWPLVWHMAFPIHFLLVCVPWPSKQEIWLIQSLTSLAAQITATILQTVGIAAMCRGNVIELGVGILGINEACSGIRSFQSSLLASLFLGEFYAMRMGWRITLVTLGLGLAYGLNLVRMLVLSLAASAQGIKAIEAWHDPAGMWIQLATFGLLWGACVGIAKITSARQAMDIPSTIPFGARLPRSAAWGGGLVLAVSIFYQLGTEGWFRWHEARMVKLPAWRVAAAVPGATDPDQPLDENARIILRFDEGFQRAWRDDVGRQWGLLYLRWNPSKVAVNRARNHTPEICQRGVGHELLTTSGEKTIEVHGVPLTYRIYSLRADGRPLHVFYFFTDDRMQGPAVFTQSLTPNARLQPVLEGRRNSGQRSMQLTVFGIENAAEAEKAVMAKLPEVVSIDER